MGVAETKEALRAEVLKVCRFYFVQVWNEALDQVGVEASSALRRVESVYYLLAIRAQGSKVDTASKEADEGKESPTKALPTANIPPKEAKQSEVAEKVADLAKEVADDANLPPTAPKEPSKEKKASHIMEIVLTTLLIPTKDDLRGKAQASSMAAFTQPTKTPKDKLVIKMKPWVVFLFFFFLAIVFVSKLCNPFTLL